MERTGREKLLLFMLCFMTAYHFIARLGLALDIQWHTDVGRDQLLTPPHLMIISGLFPTLALCFLYIFLETRDLRRGKEIKGMKIGFFISPVGIWMTVSGLLTILIGGIYDDYWHAEFGIDTTVVTPPHMLTIGGGMIAELACAILIIQAKRKWGEKAPKYLDWLLIVTMWTLLIHGHFTAMNFLDSRVAIWSIGSVELLPHIFLAPFAILSVISFVKHWLGDSGVLRLAGLTLSIQLGMLLFIPTLVDAMMGPEHVYRPGAPNTVWAANCMPWLLLPASYIICRYNLWKKPIQLALAIIVADAIWLPTMPDYFPLEVHPTGLAFSVIIGIIFLRYTQSLIHRFISSMDSLTDEKSINFKLPKIGKPSTVIVVLMAFLLMPATVGSAHELHREEGQGFDAPMRLLIDVNGTEIWAEFMLWPPKATQGCELFLLPSANVTTEIDNMWVEIVFQPGPDEVRMIQYFEKYSDQQMWHAELNFPFGGENDLEIYIEIDGEESVYVLPLQVDAPSILPVWLAWTISSIWVFGLTYYWYRTGLVEGIE